MHLYHFTLTLTGAAQQLTANDGLLGSSVSLQPGGANAGPVFVGGQNLLGVPTVTSTVYGVRLPTSVSGVPSEPYGLGPQMVTLQDIIVLGTANDTLKVSYWGERASGFSVFT